MAARDLLFPDQVAPRAPAKSVFAFCLASTHTAVVSSPSQAVLRLLSVNCVCVCMREIFINQQEITTLTVILSCLYVSLQRARHLLFD